MDITPGTIEEYLEQWKMLSDKLKAAKAMEMEMRKEIVAFLQPKALPGTFDHDNLVMKVKVKIGLNYKFDQEELDAREEDMTNAEAACINYKPSLLMKNYKMIPGDNREELDACLIVTLAAPTLTVEYRDDPDA